MDAGPELNVCRPRVEKRKQKKVEHQRYGTVWCLLNIRSLSFFPFDLFAEFAKALSSQGHVDGTITSLQVFADRMTAV